MTEQGKATARRFFEEQDRLRGGPTEEMCAHGYMAYLAGFPPMDAEGHRAFSTPFYAAIPDLKHEIKDVIAEGDRAAVRFRMTGTDTGGFMGKPPSGKPIDIGGLALMRVVSGKVAEVYSEFDQMGLMQQIGALAAEPDL